MRDPGPRGRRGRLPRRPADAPSVGRLYGPDRERTGPLLRRRAGPGRLGAVRIRADRVDRREGGRHVRARRHASAAGGASQPPGADPRRRNPGLVRAVAIIGDLQWATSRPAGGGSATAPETSCPTGPASWTSRPASRSRSSRTGASAGSCPTGGDVLTDSGHKIRVCSLETGQELLALGTAQATSVVTADASWLLTFNNGASDHPVLYDLNSGAETRLQDHFTAGPRRAVPDGGGLCRGSHRSPAARLGGPDRKGTVAGRRRPAPRATAVLGGLPAAVAPHPAGQGPDRPVRRGRRRALGPVWWLGRQARRRGLVRRRQAPRRRLRRPRRRAPTLPPRSRREGAGHDAGGLAGGGQGAGRGPRRHPSPRTAAACWSGARTRGCGSSTCPPARSWPFSSTAAR